MPAQLGEAVPTPCIYAALLEGQLAHPHLPEGDAIPISFPSHSHRIPLLQFRALSSEAFGTQDWHQNLRRRVADHIGANGSDFRPFFPDADAFGGYVASMRESGTWGDELTLRAAADLLRVKVYVITSEESNWLLHYDPKGLAEDDHEERCVFVTYVSPIHYNIVKHLPPSHASYRAPSYEIATGEGLQEASSGAGRQVEL